MKTALLSDLRPDVAWYPRSGVDWDHVAALRESVRRGDPLPPILVSKDGFIVDGVHRFYASQAEGKTSISVEHVSEDHGPADGELWLLALTTNLKHGLLPNIADRRAHFERFVKAHGLRPVKELADAYHVHEETIRKWIKSLEAVPPSRPATAMRLSGEPPRPRDERPVTPSAVRHGERTKEDPAVLTKRAFDSLRQTLVLVANDDVTAERLSVAASALTGDDPQAVVFWSALRLAAPKLVEMFEQRYRELEINPPWR
jgi:hypothetical protein